MDGPQIWVPFSSSVKNNYGYDCRISFPKDVDKLTMFIAFNNMDDVVGEVPPIDHIKHLLQPDEQLGGAARKIICWWNPTITIGSEPVEVVAVKSSKGDPKGIIYYHKGLRLPEKQRRKILDFSLNPKPQPI